MAQVIKYQQGGSTSKKYGTFTIDGNTYQVDDEFLNQMSNYGKSLDEDTAYQFSKITDALRSGENLSYNSNADRLDENVQFDITDKQKKRLSKRRSGLGRLFGNSWKGKENASRNAIHSLRDFVYTKPAPSNNVYDFSSGINVEYKRDKDGKYELVDGKRVFIQGANNLQVGRRLRALKNIASYTDNDTFKGYGKLDKQAYIDLYNHLGDEGIANLIQRVESGTWTDEDKMSLDDIGIFLDPETDLTKVSTEKAAKQEISKKLSDRGISSPNSSKYVTVDDNDNLIVTDLFNKTFGDKNAIYNDWWQQYMTKTNQWNPDFSFLNGYTRVGNRLYKTSDLADENSELYKFARQEEGFYDLNASNKFNEANSILEYLWGRTDNSSKFDRNNLYSSWFNNQDPNLRYRSLTGTRQLPDNQQLIEYWDNDNKDMYGRPSTYKYALLDSYGNLIQDNVDVNDFDIIEDGEQIGLSALQKINQPGSPYHGRYIMNFSDPSGSVSDYELYIDPNNPDDIILRTKELDNWNATKNRNIRIPRELAHAINNNPNFWNNLLSNKTLQNRFIRSLVEGVRTKTGDALTTVWPLSTSTMEMRNWERLGFDRTTAARLYNYLEDIYGDRNGNSLWERRNNYLVTPYQQNIPVHQKGGVIGTTKDATGSNAKTNIDSYKDPSKAAGYQDGWNLSHADKLQIASIAGDVASLVAAIPTGGNPVAGALGYGSTLTQFGADVSRDGFDLGDLGNLALGLGLDTISLLPGIGISGKIAKMGKAVKKSASLLKNVLLTAGAVDAAFAVNNIASGKATLDDWKSLSTGLFAIKGIKNEVQNLRSTQYKGKAPKLEAKTKEDLKREYIDKIVADKKLGFIDNKPTRWANPDGTVKNYSQAIEDLTKSGNLKISKTQEAKWAAEAAKSKTSAAATNLFSGSYNPLSRNYRFRMSNRQLPDDFDLKPLKDNTSKLRTLGRALRQYPEIARQLQDKGWILPSTLRFNSRHGGNWFYRSPMFSKFIKFKNPSMLMLPESTGVRDIPTTLSGRRSPIEILNIDPYLQQVSDYIGLKFHKKGGKIVKAQTGSDSDWFLNKDGNPLVSQIEEIAVTAKTPNARPSKLIRGITPVSGTFDPNIRKGMALAAASANAANKARVEAQLATNSTGSKDTNSIGSKKMYGHNGNSGERFNINPDMLLGIGDFITSTRGINRTTQKMKDAIRKGMIGSQQQMPTEFYSRFSDNGLHRMYEDRIKQMRQYKTITSDPNQVMAERLMRDMNVDQMAAERDTKFSQMIDQYNDKILAQRQQYANIRNQIVNDNKNRWYQGLVQLDMADANKIGQQTQNVKNLIYQFRQDYAKDLQDRIAIEDKLNSINAETKYQNELKQLFESLGGFNSMSASDKELWGNNWVGYINYKVPDQVSNIRSKAFFDNYQDQANDPKRRHSWVRWFNNLDIPRYINQLSPRIPEPKYHRFKSGGTVPRFRKTNEQAFLDQQKAINKAVNDLNNNIIKLFIKMMS